MGLCLMWYTSRAFFQIDSPISRSKLYINCRKNLSRGLRSMILQKQNKKLLSREIGRDFSILSQRKVPFNLLTLILSHPSCSFLLSAVKHRFRLVESEPDSIHSIHDHSHSPGSLLVSPSDVGGFVFHHCDVGMMT